MDLIHPRDDLLLGQHGTVSTKLGVLVEEFLDLVIAAWREQQLLP